MGRGFIEGFGGVRIAYVDFGGNGPGLLLLHGLMGRATTWHDTAGWLVPHFHVVGIDQRGHGLSDKPDASYSIDEYVNDAAAAIEKLHLGPASIIGHSMGGLIGWTLAARRPELVQSLVVQDMPADHTGKDSAAEFKDWYATWPVPFPTMASVRGFFGAMRPSLAEYFMEVMVEKEDGYWPQFSFDHMLRSARQWSGRCFWDVLSQVRCPALVVGGSLGDLSESEARKMAECMKSGQHVEVAGAHHTVHFDRTDEWRAAVEPFLLRFLSQRDR
jgi:pimeloyl-ACP methyl ester carboxylesterase